MNLRFAPVWSQKLTSLATIAAVLTLSVSVLFAVPSAAQAATTNTLYPNGQGSDTDWTGDEDDVDETGSADCGSADGNGNVSSSTTGQRESVLIDLSSVLDGSTITSVAVNVTYRNGNGGGTDDGTFQTFARLNGGTRVDSGTNLTATNTTCTSGAQTIDVSDVVKSGATTLEVGVLKTATDTSEVWVGTIRADVTYTLPSGWVPPSASLNNSGVTNPDNAFTSDNSYAVIDSQSDIVDYRNFGFSIPSGASIDGIQVAVEANRTDPRTVDLSLSWNGGTSFTPVKNVGSYGTSDSIIIAGGTSDTWGRTWSDTEFSNTNFRLRVDAVSSGSGDTISLDQILIKVSYTLVGDVTPPTLAVVTPVPTPDNDSTPDFTFSSNEAGTISYGGSCSSGTSAASAGDNTVTFNALADGTYSDCTVTVTDAALNASLALAVPTFIVDTVAPTIGEVSSIPTPTADSTPDYSFGSDEAGSVNYLGACTSATTVIAGGNSTVIFNTLADGVYSCSLSVTDAAGNTSDVLDITEFTIDTTKPDVTLSWGVSNPTNVSPIEITVSFNEGVSGFDGSDVSLTNASINSLSGGPSVYTLSILPGGDGTVSAFVDVNKAQDAAGNGNNASNGLTTVYDGSVPSVTITGGPLENGYTNDNETDFPFTDSGATTIECQIDGGGYSACSSPFTTPVLSDGAHVFNVRASDGLNPTATATRNFNIDTTRPEPLFGATISDPNNDSLTHVAVTFTTAVINFVAADLTVSNATIENFSGSGTTYGFDLAPIADGLVTLDMAENVADEANGSGNGNTVPLLSISYTYDTTPPVIDVHGDETVEAVYANSAVVNYTAPDAVDAVDGTSPAVCSPASGSTFAYGDTTVTCDATDAAGNDAIQTSFTISLVDTTGPSLSLVTPIPSTVESHQPNFVFNSDEAGTITYGGACSSATTAASSGNNFIVLNFLPLATYGDCTLTVTDGALNTSAPLGLPAFTISEGIGPAGGGGGNGLFSLPNSSNAPGTTPGSVLGAFTTGGQESQGNTQQGQVLGETAFLFEINLRYGMTNNDVTELQKVLIKLGLLKIAAPTGWFGPMTLAAVKQFQTDHGIPSTGFVGPLTRAALNALNGQ